MTPKDLRNYKNLQRTIDLLKRRYVELSEKTTKDSVMGSNPMFPYEERHFTIEGDAPLRELQKIEEDIAYYEDIKKRIDSLRSYLLDPVDKLILEYTLQGKTQTITGDFVGLSQEAVSWRLRKILNWLEN